MPLYEFAGKKPTVDRGAFIHPQAVLIGAVTIEADCYVGAGAVLRGDFGSIFVRKGSNVQENAVVHTFSDESTIIHPDVIIGHSCILHGCEVCSNVLIGMGAIVADGSKINSNCIVAAGSFVSLGWEVPAGSVVAGSPARIVKAITQRQLEDIRNGLELYQELTKQYLSSFKEVSFQ